jgi:hypothetical protein
MVVMMMMTSSGQEMVRGVLDKTPELMIVEQMEWHTAKQMRR